MGDTFWMEDEARVEWEEVSLNRGNIFREVDKLPPSKTLPFLNSQIKEYIFRKAQYPLTNTGSQYLDPTWRKNIVKIKRELAVRQVLISLN